MDGVIRLVKFDTKRPFGMELELNRKVTQEALVTAIRRTDPKRMVERSGHYQHTEANNPYWHVKFDRSCGDRPQEGAWEIASYKGHGYKDISKMQEVVGAVRDIGAAVNKNCAVHVHVEVGDFSQADAAALVANWMRAEEVIAQAVPKHRRNNVYCALLTQRYRGVSKTVKYKPDSFWQLVRPQDASDFSRRVSMNMVNFTHRHTGKVTAEIRLPDAVLDPKDVGNWIRFFVHFVEVSKERGFPESLAPASGVDEALAVCGLHGDKPFLILSKGLRETKVWLLRRIMRHSEVKPLVEQAGNRLAIMKPPTKKSPPPSEAPAAEKSPPPETTAPSPQRMQPSEWLQKISETYQKIYGNQPLRRYDAAVRESRRQDPYSERLAYSSYYYPSDYRTIRGEVGAFLAADRRGELVADPVARPD